MKTLTKKGSGEIVIGREIQPMTPDEVLAVIRERVKKWRLRPRPDLEPEVIREVVAQLLDDLDPDRIDAAGRMREELAETLRQFHEAHQPVVWPDTWWSLLADALLAKGWRK